MHRTEHYPGRSRALAPAALLLLALCLLAGSVQASYTPGIQRFVVGDVLEITGADGTNRIIIASVDTASRATRNYTAYGVVQDAGRWEIPRYWHQELKVDEQNLVESLHARRVGHADPVIVIITDATVTGGGMQYAGLSLAEALAGKAYPVAPAPGEPSPSSPLYLEGDIAGEHWLIAGVTTENQPEPAYSTYSVFQHGDRWYIEKYWHGNDNFPESWLREHNFTRTHHADPHTIIINETTLTGGDFGYWRYSLAELATIGGYPAENWEDRPTLGWPARYNVGDILGNDTSPARYVVGAVEIFPNQYPLYTAYPVVRNGTDWDIPSFGHGVFFRADALQVYELAMHRLDHTDPHFAIVTDPEITASNLYCYGLSLGEILDGVHGYPPEDPVGPFPTPYRPGSVPGRIEAEDYDLGGEGAAYHDTTLGNTGGAYRHDDVDIESGNGITNVGWIRDGEWLTYTVNVTEAGSYRVNARVASPNGNRTISLSVDDQYPMTLAVPNTGSFGTFAPAGVPIVCWDPPNGVGSCDPVPIAFSAGTHTLKLAFHGDGQNIDYLEFTPEPQRPTPTPTPTPFVPGPFRPHSLPGRVEAEDYDLGGEGAAYHDTTPGNTGGAYRNDDVDIETANGVTNVGWIRDGEWLRYTLNVTQAGQYTMTARVASPNSGRTIAVSVDGTAAGTIAVPNTGSFSDWRTVPVPVTLAAGTHTVWLTFAGDGQNIDWFEFSPYVEPTPTPTVTPTPTPEIDGTPYRPLSIPGTIQAEDYDLGGEGVAYHDTTPGNAGGAYRHDDVDIEKQAGLSTPNIGWIREGEYLGYTVNVAQTGDYYLALRVASPHSYRNVVVSVDDGWQEMWVLVPNTGSFERFATAVEWSTRTRPSAGVTATMTPAPTATGGFTFGKNPVRLTAGTHTLKLAFSGDGQNLDWITFEPVGATPTPTPEAGGASFSAVPTTAPSGSTVTFTVTPASGKSIASAWWSFDAPAHLETWNSRNVNPTFFYPAKGTFSPLVKITYTDGTTETVQRTGYIRAT
ncbi:MAG: carbohydrate-binding protein [Methanospirillum sp.]